MKTKRCVISIIATFLIPLFLTGCGASPEEKTQREARARTKAVADLEKARDAFAQGKLRDAGRAMESARANARNSGDPALSAEVVRFDRSPGGVLLGIAATYNAMCKEAGWNLFWDFVADDYLFSELSRCSSEKLSAHLVTACASVGDRELTASATAVADEWTTFISWQRTRQLTENSESGVGAFVALISTAGQFRSSDRLQKKQREFETRLTALMKGATLPEVAFPPPATAASVAAPPPPPRTPPPRVTARPAAPAPAPIPALAPANAATPAVPTVTAMTGTRRTSDSDDLDADLRNATR